MHAVPANAGVDDVIGAARGSQEDRGAEDAASNAKRQRTPSPVSASPEENAGDEPIQAQAEPPEQEPLLEQAGPPEDELFEEREEQPNGESPEHEAHLHDEELLEGGTEPQGDELCEEEDPAVLACAARASDSAAARAASCCCRSSACRFASAWARSWSR